jgi:hypothetical protein
MSAWYALELAESCCSAGKLDDEALLLQVLQSCSAGLRADVVHTAAALQPAAATDAAAQRSHPPSDQTQAWWLSDWAPSVTCGLQVCLGGLQPNPGICCNEAAHMHGDRPEP